MGNSNAHVVALGGGKGGVGKSFVAVNLAVTLARAGKRVVMLDADFGGANLHTLFGIQHPDRTVMDFVSGNAKRLADVAIGTRFARLSVLAGTCDVLGSADLAAEHKKRLIEGLQSLDTDVLIIDVGAGTGVHSVDLFNAADTKLLVITPELTSVQNAYGFLKIAVYRCLQRIVEGHPGEARLKDAMGDGAFEVGSTMKDVETFIMLAATEAPELERPFRLMLSQMNVHLVGNMLHSDSDRSTVWAIKRLIEKFLRFDAGVLAAFGHSGKVRRTVNSGVPLVATARGDSTEVAEFRRLARRVLEQDLSPYRALRTEIEQALQTVDGHVDFGFDAIEIEIEEVTDPTELAEIHAAAREERRSRMRSEPPPRARRSVPPPASRPAPAPRHRRTSGVQPAIGARPAPRSVAPPPRPSFIAELSLVRRSVVRGEVNVEVEVMGQWFLGSLSTVDHDRVAVRGVHPFGSMDGQRCRLRIAHVKVEDQEAAVPAEVIWRGYEPLTGEATLEFTDPELCGQLLAYVSQQSPRAASQ